MSLRTFAARSLVLTLGLGAAAAGCVQKDNDPHEFTRAIPQAEDVRIKLPEGSDALRTVGQIADWYVATRNVTRTLNGGTAWVLIVVHTIVQFPPTSVDGATATWGPWSGALDPAEYRLVVTADDDGSFDWHLDGRSKTVAGAEFESVVIGDAFPSDPVGRGHGTFTLDFDAAERVNPVDNDGRGVIDVDYDLAARTLAIHVATVEDRAGSPTAVEYDYAYAEAADGSGDMSFAVHGDTADAGPAAEEALLRSRWLATGAGRSDVRLSSGDLADVEVVASECWDTTFRRVYYTDSVQWQPTEGDAAACAFADQDLPQP